jgi:glycosyltransferase involved in cell wall biosynthesis
LDCLATGTPVIVNTHATSAELPDDVVHKISDHFATSELAAAIDLLAKDSLLRTALATRARAHLVEHHHPERVGEAFRDAIAKYEQYGQAAIERPLIQALADFVSPIYPDRDDHYRLATTIATTWPRTVAMQILYDVTVLAESDARTGIQRVVRSILINLIENPPPGFRIEPVIMDNHRFRYARQWTAKALDLPSWVFPDDPVEFQAGDIYLAIDWVPDRLPDTEGWLADFGRAGGRVVIGVHDLLPFHFPEHFPDFMPTVMRHWFETALRTADQFVCVSRTVADDVVKFGSALMDGRKRRIAVDFFHNAADLSSSAPTRGRPSNADDIVAHLKARPSFLMVGTIEPRKGHTQVLRGFERLWRQQQDVNLVIVGKKGWMMGELINALERHRESDTRLFWLSDISDEFLEELYAACSALVAASAGEGFGLPLIEAARHGLPLIVRDIAVFREVAGENAFYFSGDTPQAISDALLKWLELEAQAKAPGTENLHFQTWRESTKQLVKNLLATNHYAEFGNCPALPTSES